MSERAVERAFVFIFWPWNFTQDRMKRGWLRLPVFVLGIPWVMPMLCTVGMGVILVDMALTIKNG